jgi:nucleolar protein TMA23
MDTARYLKSQGWLGTGHALSTGKGLTKPLLVSRKSDVLGLGKKHKQADQWWTRAFDDSLSGLEVQHGDIGADGVREVTVTQTKKGGVLEGLLTGKGSLYSMFVKGEGLVGTIGKGMVKGETTENRRRGEQGGSRDCTGDDGKLQKGKSYGNVGEITTSKELKPRMKRGKQRRETRSLDPFADENLPSKDLELKRERRRQRREIKALRLLKRGDLPAESTSPDTSHRLEGVGPEPRASSADEELTQARKLRKKVEKSSDTSKTTTLLEGGDAVSSKKTRKKKRRLAL